jgi:hypothetical protein
MEVPKALFPYSGALISFVRAVKSDLFAESRIMYFEIAKGAHQIIESDLNKNILNSIGGKSGVYAIWVKRRLRQPSDILGIQIAKLPGNGSEIISLPSTIEPVYNWKM